MDRRVPRLHATAMSPARRIRTQLVVTKANRRPVCQAASVMPRNEVTTTHFGRKDAQIQWVGTQHVHHTAEQQASLSRVSPKCYMMHDGH